MEDIAVLFAVAGVLSYPLFLHLSLKKALSLVTKGKVNGGRTFACLVAVYFETVFLLIPAALVSPTGEQFFVPALITLPVIVLVVSYTLKSMFHLPLRRTVIAFLLWQGLSVALRGLFIGTGLFLIFQPSLTLLWAMAIRLRGMCLSPCFRFMSPPKVE